MKTLVILLSLGLVGCSSFGQTAHRVNDGARTTVEGICAIPPGLIFDTIDWAINTGEDLVDNTADATVQ